MLGGVLRPVQAWRVPAAGPGMHGGVTEANLAGLRHVVPVIRVGAPVRRGLLMSPSGRWLRCPSSLSLLLGCSRLILAVAARCGSGWRACRTRGTGGGVRFSVACVIAIAIAARLAGCDSFTARRREWAASRPQRDAQSPGLPAEQAGRGPRRPVGEDDRGGSPASIDHDLADDLLCGHAAELAAVCEVLSPAKLQERRRDKARKARAKARKAARHARGARELLGKRARKAARRERKAAAAAIAASAAAVAGGRAKLPAGSAFGRVPVPAGHPVFPAVTCGDPRYVPALRGLGADRKACRGARLEGLEAPQHLGFFWCTTPGSTPPSAP